MELESWQLYLIGAVAALLSQGLKLISAKLGYEPSKLVTTIAVFVVSLGLAFAFARPAFPDPSAPDFLPQLVNVLTALVGAAMVVYNVLLEKVFAKTKLTTKRFLPKG